MAIIAKESGGSKFEPIEEGTYSAICYSIVDIGDVYSEKFNNTSRKILITFELPDEMIEVEGELKPRAISKEYTLSLSEKANLRKDLEAWRSKKFSEAELEGFDLKNILGKGCQVSIVHTSRSNNVYANIAAIIALPKGIKSGTPANSLVYFDLESENALEELNKLPTWVQDKVRKSETYKITVDNPFSIVDGQPFNEDDLPFN